MEFNILLEDFLKKLGTTEGDVLDGNDPIIRNFFDAIRVSRIDVIFYDNKRKAKLGHGRRTATYDSGKKGSLAFTDSINTDIMTIIERQVFLADGEEPWNDKEIERIRLLLEILNVFFSRRKIEAAAARFAFFDDDGYSNLRSFNVYLDQKVHDSSVYGMACIHFNLKHFARVNEQVGRRAGNLVMRSYFDEFVHILGDSGKVCRFGGDNFALICPGDKLDTVLERLNGTAVVYDKNTGDRIMVSASAGVYVIPEDGEAPETNDIIDKMMTCSAAARSNSNTNVVFYSDDLISVREKISRMQHIFPLALENEEFAVYYQPKVDITTGELVGAEALCRWFRGDEVLYPCDFIPTLEQGMEICKLDFYMLDHVCRDVRQWLDEGRNVVRISVNLSRRHMADYDLLEHLIEIIDRNNVPHEYIEIELAETTTDVEFRDLKRVVKGLRKAGVRTSVDDFGMGYSSLNLIKEIPWDVLKVDKSFLPVAEDNETSTRSIMFKYVIKMAQKMGLECIAEGVETREQIEILKANNCDQAQGFYFNKPLPRAEFEKRMEERFYPIPE